MRRARAKRRCPARWTGGEPDVATAMLERRGDRVATGRGWGPHRGRRRPRCSASRAASTAGSAAAASSASRSRRRARAARRRAGSMRDGDLPWFEYRDPVRRRLRRPRRLRPGGRQSALGARRAAAPARCGDSWRRDTAGGRHGRPRLSPPARPGGGVPGAGLRAARAGRRARRCWCPRSSPRRATPPSARAGLADQARCTAWPTSSADPRARVRRHGLPDGAGGSRAGRRPATGAHPARRGRGAGHAAGPSSTGGAPWILVSSRLRGSSSTRLVDSTPALRERFRATSASRPGERRLPRPAGADRAASCCAGPCVDGTCARSPRCPPVRLLWTHAASGDAAAATAASCDRLPGLSPATRFGPARTIAAVRSGPCSATGAAVAATPGGLGRPGRRGWRRRRCRARRRR